MSSSPQDFTQRHSPFDGEILHSGYKPVSQFPTSREWLISLLFFLITTLSVTFAGLFYVSGDINFLDSIWITFNNPASVLYGLWYSIPLILILFAHEMGHFMACCYYGIRCTPPYFIPVPISITGTLGAFIKIKSPFNNKRALFDVGIAGPLAGFIVTLPVLYIGISLSRLVPRNLYGSEMILFGEPLIFRMIGVIALQYDPAVHDMQAHPIAMAGWFGLLVTGLNLLPVWQLDGGHIAYAVFGRTKQKRFSIIALILLMLVGLSGWPTPSYLVFGFLVFILGYRHKFYHPATLDDGENLGTARIILSVVALIILVLCFTPVPITITY